MKHRHRPGRALCTTLLCFLLPVWPAALRAQDPAVQVGTRVRIVAPPYTDGRMIGSVVAVGDLELALDTLADSGATAPFMIPREAIESIEISLGQRSNTWNGLAYGVLGGAVLGAGFIGVILLVELAEGGGSTGDMSIGGRFAVGAVLGAGAGAVLGTIVGSLIKTERWAELSAQAKP